MKLYRVTQEVNCHPSRAAWVVAESESDALKLAPSAKIWKGSGSDWCVSLICEEENLIIPTAECP